MFLHYLVKRHSFILFQIALGARQMTYLARNIDRFLAEWKTADDRLPVIVKGPRQVGKTESIKRFAQSAYRNLVEINFVEEPRYKHICDDGYDTASILRNISLLDPSKRLEPGETLLFFDELQEYPEIATALKFFHQGGRFDVICSGSMLGISYRRIESNSVGYKVDYEMHSLDFGEFLAAKGYGDELAADMLSHIEEARAFSQLELETYQRLFLDYCILGGMPAVVRPYIERGTFEGCLATQRQLLLDYEEDIVKYAEGLDQGRTLNVFRSIPLQLAKENKKFQISKVARAARFKDYRGCIEWLETAGMIGVRHCLNYPELPLKGNYDEGKYKIYYRDNGMFVASLDDEASEDLRVNKNLGVYKGAMSESVVGEALQKSGYGLFYYKKENSTLEEDFFVRTRDRLVPVEVKAKNGTAKSLRTLIESDAYPDIGWGVKLCGGNVGREGSVLTLPYFTAFLLCRYLAGK